MDLVNDTTLELYGSLRFKEAIRRPGRLIVWNSSEGPKDMAEHEARTHTFQLMSRRPGHLCATKSVADRLPCMIQT